MRDHFCFYDWKLYDMLKAFYGKKNVKIKIELCTWKAGEWSGFYDFGSPIISIWANCIYVIMIIDVADFFFNSRSVFSLYIFVVCFFSINLWIFLTQLEVNRFSNDCGVCFTWFEPIVSTNVFEKKRNNFIYLKYSKSRNYPKSYEISVNICLSLATKN